MEETGRGGVGGKQLFTFTPLQLFRQRKVKGQPRVSDLSVTFLNLSVDLLLLAMRHPAERVHLNRLVFLIGSL